MGFKPPAEFALAPLAAAIPARTLGTSGKGCVL